MPEAPFSSIDQPAAAPEPSILKSAGAIGIATFLSRIMGLVREQVFAILFGAGNLTDAFTVAFRIPNLLRNLFAEGAMSASLIPTFTRSRLEHGDRRAWRVAGLVFRVLWVVVGTVALVGVLLAPQLVELYASPFHQVPGKFELTVLLTRILFPFFPLVALAAAYMGILNACGLFFLPAFSSALFNMASVVVGVICAKVFMTAGAQWGIQPIVGMAIGVVFGGVIQAFCQLPALRRVGYRRQRKQAEDPVWHQDPYLRRMLGMMIPGIVGLAATQVSILVNTLLATSQGPGAVSWLNYAFRLMQFPIGIFGVALATATLPRVSRQWVQKDLPGVEKSLTQSLKNVFSVNLPASAGLAFLGYPIIELIFQYGRFTQEDTQKTAFALAVYALGLTAYSAVKVLVPVCYAVGNASVPVISSILTVCVTTALNLLMIRPLGYWGLALGTSIGAFLNCGLLLVSLRRMLRAAGGTFAIGPLARSFGEQLAIAAAMGAACMATHQALNWALPEFILVERIGRGAVPVLRAFKVGLVILEGGILVILLAKFFRITETTEVIDLFSQKMKKKLSRGRN